MDFPEATRVVFDRIQKFEQENVSKIMGYLLLHVTEREMIRLAFIPDNLLQDLVNKSKNAIPRLMSRQPISAHVSTAINPLSVSEIPAQFVPFSFLSTRPLSATAFLTPFWAAGQPFVHNTDFTKSGYFNSIAEVEKPTPFSSLEDQFDEVDSGMSGFSNDCYYPEESFNNLSARMSRRSSSLPEFPVKTCHYFNKGYCKHGSNCRYFHDQNFLESSHFGQNGNDIASDDQVFLPDSLEKLEKEIAELLRSRRGQPVSIASLPMMYYEQYGKVLQADGYLTESQRHGKAGYSLTKLLARLKNSISLIDRPHGQHSVVLAEDASKYLESQGERSDPGPIVSGSRQIYLTFPAESTFTEEDVSDYFNTFGPVDDVRIPCQQKRMFGFVTFSSSDTVKVILAKGNPHFVCGARVLVKPYREKPKLFDRRYYPAYSVDMEPELHSIARRHESSRLLRKQFIEEQEQALELQREHLARLQLAQKSLTSQLCMTCCMDETQVSEEHSDHLLLNNGSSSDDNPRSTSTDCTDQESNQGADLPQSPLASPMKSSISTVV